MRKLIVHLIIASFTFVFSVMVSYLVQRSIPNLVNDSEIQKPIKFTFPEVRRTCEVHGSSLRKERIQRICGEFKGSLKGGGWGQFQFSCEGSKQSRISGEDAQFFFHMYGGLDSLMWGKNYEAAKRTQFPHGYSWPYKECESNGERCVTIEVCTECRAAEVRWKQNAYSQ